MNYVVIDTDAFSHLWQGSSLSAGLELHLKGVVPVLSFATVGEIYFGAAYAGWGSRKISNLDEAIRRYVITPYHDDLAKLWGALKSQARRSGHALGHNAQANDLWICATAIYHDAPLLTVNQRHFAGFPGLSLL
ncbi:MAG TPA: type II toxin-antitoxin system VapC family toxin [Micromonosporaceae bacterium]|nr:type II toxin-antitoxin system VapC family toxin [Micromonosporaceae bacterium]